MQPPCTAAITGKRAPAIASNEPCSALSCCRKRSRAATDPVSSAAPSRNSDRSIPALKCLPLEHTTAARVPPSASSPRRICGSSSQNSRVMAFSRSGRLRRMSATCASRVTSKHS